MSFEYSSSEEDLLPPMHKDFLFQFESEMNSEELKFIQTKSINL